MKKLLCLLLLLGGLTYSHAQMVFLEGGKLISSFNYRNSKGEAANPWSGSVRNNLGLGYRQCLFSTPLHVSVEGLYNQYYIQGSDVSLGNIYEYDMNYLGTELMIDYEFLKPELNYNDRQGLSFCVMAGGMADFLLKGSQRLNDKVFDLIGKEEFDYPILYLKGGVSVNYYLTKSYFLFAKYRYGKSFLLGDYSHQEQLKFNTHSATIGLVVNFTYQGRR